MKTYTTLQIVLCGECKCDMERIIRKDKMIAYKNGVAAEGLFLWCPKCEKEVVIATYSRDDKTGKIEALPINIRRINGME